MLAVHRSMRTVIAVVGISLATLLPLATPASAATYARGGQIGPHWSSTLDCRHKVFGTSSVLQVVATAPTIYATNFRAGSGNDGAYVRYRAFLVNSQTNAVVTSTNWSGYSWALDNRPAAFAGFAATLAGDWRGHYVVDYRIEWYQPGARAAYAWAAVRADRYLYTASNNVAGGLWQGCFKYL